MIAQTVQPPSHLFAGYVMLLHRIRDVKSRLVTQTPRLNKHAVFGQPRKQRISQVWKAYVTYFFGCTVARTVVLDATAPRQAQTAMGRSHGRFKQTFWVICGSALQIHGGTHTVARFAFVCDVRVCSFVLQSTWLRWERLLLCCRTPHGFSKYTIVVFVHLRGLCYGTMEFWVLFRLCPIVALLITFSGVFLRILGVSLRIVFSCCTGVPVLAFSGPLFSRILMVIRQAGSPRDVRKEVFVQRETPVWREQNYVDRNPWKLFSKASRSHVCQICQTPSPPILTWYGWVH